MANSTLTRPVVIARRAAPSRRVSQRFSLVLTLLLMATVVWGFWPTYFGPLVGGRVVSRPLSMHLHAAVFSGWMLLLLAQVLLVALGRVRWHRQLGRVGVGYGMLVLATGLTVTFSAPVRHVQAGEWSLDQAAAFLLLPLVDMLLFAGFFGAAIAYRHRPEVHKRLIVAATIALAFAAVGRVFEASLAGFFAVWLSPLAAAMLFDLYTRHRVHPVYWVSAGIFVAAFSRLLIMESPSWLRVGRAILRPLL